MFVAYYVLTLKAFQGILNFNEKIINLEFALVLTPCRLTLNSTIVIILSYYGLYQILRIERQYSLFRVQQVGNGHSIPSFHLGT